MRFRFLQIAAVVVQLGALMAPSSVLAEEKEPYRLFEADGSPSRHYASILGKGVLRPGDVLAFPDGKSFVFEKVLGEGSVTKVLAVRWKNGQVGSAGPIALRIPLFVDDETRIYIDETLHGYRDLHEAGVPMVELKHGVSMQYAVVERADVMRLPNGDELTFDLFVKKYPFNLVEPDEITRQFFEFVEQTAHLGIIGDLKPEQIAYVRGRGWVVLDWFNEIAIGKHAEASYNVFQGFGERFLGRSLQRWQSLQPKVIETVAAARRRPRALSPRLEEIGAGGVSTVQTTRRISTMPSGAKKSCTTGQIVDELKQLESKIPTR